MINGMSQSAPRQSAPKATPPTSLERFKGHKEQLNSAASATSAVSIAAAAVAADRSGSSNGGGTSASGGSSAYKRLRGSNHGPGADKDKAFAAAEALEKKMGLMSFLQLKSRSRLRGDGKGMMSFEYYDPNNPPPWLTPPWNVGPRTAPPRMGMPQPGSRMAMPYVSSNYGAIPPGAAPQMGTPYSYNPGMATSPIPPRL